MLKTKPYSSYYRELVTVINSRPLEEVFEFYKIDQAKVGRFLKTISSLEEESEEISPGATLTLAFLVGFLVGRDEKKIARVK